MVIRQITSKIVCGPEHVGKWYCADSVTGADGEAVCRYLQLDGTWGRNTQYFNNRAELERQLAKGNKPDFSVSREEQASRNCIKAWMESEDSREEETDYRDYDNEDY